MNLESLGFLLMALGILVAHLATLRILTDCKRELSNSATNFNGSILDVNESMSEVIRIGSDVADQIDNLAASQGVAQATGQSQPVDIQSTIMSLIANQFLGPKHGSETQPERAIYEENDTTTPSVTDE